jgi:diguanylate cyclase (GGDEF)-like protein
VVRWLLLAFALSALAYLSGGLAFAERQLTELKFSLTRRPPTGELVMVAIDARSLHEIGVWPWPRSLHAALLDRLVAAGARRIAFDIDFSSPSAPEADGALERALRAANGTVALAAHRQVQRGADGPFLIQTRPLARFAEHAAVASTSVRPDADGAVRTLAVHELWDGGEIRSLAAFLAGDHQEHPDHGQRFSVDFGIDPHAIPLYSFVDVLVGRFDPALIRGKFVVVGATAVELGDQLPVPLYKSISGAHFLGLGSESLRQGRAMQRIGPLPILALNALIAIGLGPWLLVWPWRRALAATAAAAALVFAASLLAQWLWPVLIDAAPAMMLVLVLFPCGLVSDIDRQTQTLRSQRKQLQRTNGLMRSIVENNFDGILIVRRDGCVEMANAAAVALFRLPPPADAQAGVRMGSLLPELAPAGGDADGRLDLGCGRRELRAQRSDGSSFPAEVVTSRIAEEDEALFVAVVHDISARKAQQHELEHQALHDALTELPNRRMIIEHLDRVLAAAKAAGQPLALLLLDLDRFKAINDTLGHEVGDRLLRAVADRLRATLGDATIIGRLGGDEFAAILPPPCGGAQAAAAARRIMQALAEPFEIDAVALDVAASIGIALYPDHADDQARLLRCADVAMYAAKQQGGGVASYDREKDDNSVRSLVLTGELRRAIETRSLFLAFQPKVDLRSGRVCGVEALSRWVHPVHGFIPPDQFIPHAERTGLIQPLTQWCLETALERIVELRAKVPELSVAVNLSTRSLHAGDVPKTIEGLISKWGIRPEGLTLEVTESALMEDPQRSLDVLHRLSALGLRLSIDDFGTGYSSLAYLKSLPVDELKIDKAFVMHLHEDERDAKIVRSTIDLAHGLGLQVVAEGVETEAHVAALAAFGCDVGQGYLFSKPLPVDQWLAWAEGSRWACAGKRIAGAAQTAA